MRDVGEALLEGKSLGLYPTSAYSLKQNMQIWLKVKNLK